MGVWLKVAVTSDCARRNLMCWLHEQTKGKAKLAECKDFSLAGPFVGNVVGYEPVDYWISSRIGLLFEPFYRLWINLLVWWHDGGFHEHQFEKQDWPSVNGPGYRLRCTICGQLDYYG